MKSVRAVVPKDFCGQVEINLLRGGITAVNVRQSYREETAPRT